MRKIIFAFLMITFVVCAGFAQTGIIREFSGEVEVKPAGAAAFSPARAGMEVAQNTIISTGIRSTAVIIVGSNTIVVRPITRLSLAEIQSSSNSENLSVNLQTGRVRVEVKPPAGSRANTTVQTPSATASVRGTEFEMDTISVIVDEGTVVVQGKDGLGVPVNEGNSTTMQGDSAPTQNEIFAQSLTPDSPPGAVESRDTGSATVSGGSVDPIQDSGDFDIILKW